MQSFQRNNNNKSAAGVTRVQINQLSKLVLALPVELKNALAFEGQVVLLPTDQGLELRVLKDGILIQPTVMPAVRRFPQVIAAIKKAKTVASKDPVKEFVLSHGITERSAYDRAYANTAGVKDTARNLTSLQNLIEGYLPNDPFEISLVNFTKTMLLPHGRALICSYMSTNAWKDRTFRSYFESESAFNLTCLKLFTVPVNFANSTLKVVLFPKRMSNWLGIKPHWYEVVEQEKSFKDVCLYGDRLSGFLKEHTCVFEKARETALFMKEQKERDQEELYLPIIPNFPTKGEFFKSRTAFAANYAELRTPKGRWEAILMGLMAPHFVISGLRNSIDSNHLSKRFFNKKLDEINAADLARPPSTDFDVDFIRHASESWGESVSRKKDKDGKTIPFQENKDDLVSPLPLNFDGKLDITPKDVPRGQQKLAEPKELKMNFVPISPLLEEVRQDMAGSAMPPGLQSLVTNFLRSLPKALQVKFWNQAASHWDTDSVFVPYEPQFEEDSSEEN